MTAKKVPPGKNPGAAARRAAGRGDRPDRTPVGLVEIAQRLGVEPRTAQIWRHRGLLPDPPWTVSGAPAWPWSTIERWARETGRLK